MRTNRCRINQVRKASTPGSGGFILFTAAFRTTARRTDPAILFAALRAGRMSRLADDVQLIVADHSQAFGDEAPFAGERIKLFADRVPIQRQLAFAFAALDGERDPLDLADQFQRLNRLDFDAQVVFLFEIGYLSLVLAFGGLYSQAFARGVAFLPLQFAPRLFAQPAEVFVKALQITIQSPLHSVDELAQLRSDTNRSGARDRFLQPLRRPIGGQLRGRRFRRRLSRVFVHRRGQQLIDHWINRASVDQVDSEPDDPLALLVRDRDIAEDEDQIARPCLFDPRQTVNGVLQHDVALDYAFDVAELRDCGALGELQTPPALVEQSGEFFEPVRFETRAFGAGGQFRREAQPQKLRRADRPPQIFRQHRFQPLWLDGFDQRALVFEQPRGEIAESV